MVIGIVDEVDLILKAVVVSEVAPKTVSTAVTEKDVETPVYFTDVYAAWQRSSNENSSTL